jgi:hypothetical protein
MGPIYSQIKKKKFRKQLVKSAHPGAKPFFLYKEPRLCWLAGVKQITQNQQYIPAAKG